MKKIIVSTLLMMVTPGLIAHVLVRNFLDKPIIVKIHYVGVGSPAECQVDPGKTCSVEKDLANVKTGYDVWLIKEVAVPMPVPPTPDAKKKDTKATKTQMMPIPVRIISEHPGFEHGDLGAMRGLDVVQHVNPEDGEILYSLYRYGH